MKFIKGIFRVIGAIIGHLSGGGGAVLGFAANIGEALAALKKLW